MARPPKFNDDEVLDRAMLTFWRLGWSTTSVRQLERSLDLKAPSIYRRFGSKDGLARAVLLRYLDRVVRRRIGRYLTGHGSPMANIRAFIESALVPAAPGDPLLGCLLTITALELPPLPAELGDLLATGLAEIEAGLERELDRAQAQGELLDGLEPATAATQLALTFQGLMVLARSGLPPGDLQAKAATALSTLTRR